MVEKVVVMNCHVQLDCGNKASERYVRCAFTPVGIRQLRGPAGQQQRPQLSVWSTNLWRSMMWQLRGVLFPQVLKRPVIIDIEYLCKCLWFVNLKWAYCKPTKYKYSITASSKFCSRFINSRLNAQYLASYCSICFFGILKYVCDIVVKCYVRYLISRWVLLFKTTGLPHRLK